MARIYTVNFENVAVSAVQDLVSIYLPTSAANFKQVNFIRYWVALADPTPPTTPYLLTFRLKWMPATVTAGSGGGAFTPVPLDIGDSAAKCTARINDTTQATTSGTAIVLDTQSIHIYNYYDSAIQNRPPLPLPCASTNAQALVLGLYQAPSTAIHLSGGIDFAEAG